MSHSFIKCWLHAVWTTKDGQLLITPSIEQTVYNRVEIELRSEKCFVRIINGMPDHIHSLFVINPRRSISDILQNVKGSSSHWFNQQDILPVKFAWQKGSAVFSVSESQVNRVYNYIKNQKINHRSKTWKQEIDELYKLHGRL